MNTQGGWCTRSRARRGGTHGAFALPIGNVNEWICNSLIAQVLLLLPLATVAAELRFEIKGFDATGGQAVVFLFPVSAAEHFPVAIENATCTQAGPVSADVVKLTCVDQPPGVYAALVYHDLNENEVLDHNFLGMPKEQFGFSGGCEGSFGPPDFEDCSIQVDASVVDISINML